MERNNNNVVLTPEGATECIGMYWTSCSSARDLEISTTHSDTPGWVGNMYCRYMYIYPDGLMYRI